MMELVDKIKSGVAKPSALKLVNGTASPRIAVFVRVASIGSLVVHMVLCCEQQWGPRRHMAA